MKLSSAFRQSENGTGAFSLGHSLEQIQFSFLISVSSVVGHSSVVADVTESRLTENTSRANVQSILKISFDWRSNEPFVYSFV
jgi:hypothetical protein